MADDLDLCKDCPLIVLLPDIKRRSWTQTLMGDKARERSTAMQICRRLRAEARKYPELKCPYYTRESLLGFIPDMAQKAWRRRAKGVKVTGLFSFET